ncbi:hypothetical protein ZHAS_00021409 [Anopheles sinensis]|uniref:Uncharacterized protein n=1 Tax=Anopheles sinensis TaxID=74873 RepID=A0A084WSC1_ANOSI|nr:hypothetical protein ZHAS_00021409 [Anopheles sinensis]
MHHLATMEAPGGATRRKQYLTTLASRAVRVYPRSLGLPKMFMKPGLAQVKLCAAPLHYQTGCGATKTFPV